MCVAFIVETLDRDCTESFHMLWRQIKGITHYN